MDQTRQLTNNNYVECQDSNCYPGHCRMTASSDDFMIVELLRHLWKQHIRPGMTCLAVFPDRRRRGNLLQSLQCCSNLIFIYWSTIPMLVHRINQVQVISYFWPVYRGPVIWWRLSRLGISFVLVPKDVVPGYGIPVVPSPAVF
jgi:hypothetical protein